jgi:hypothetical protein
LVGHPHFVGAVAQQPAHDGAADRTDAARDKDAAHSRTARLCSNPNTPPTPPRLAPGARTFAVRIKVRFRRGLAMTHERRPLPTDADVPGVVFVIRRARETYQVDHDATIDILEGGDCLGVRCTHHADLRMADNLAGRVSNQP